MPTAYTAGIAEGITFEQYAMQCARAFGALYVMRDDPSDAPIPETIEPPTYHRDAFNAAAFEIGRLLGLSVEDCAKEESAEYDAKVSRRAECMAESHALRTQYEAMLRRVDAWEPPTSEHRGLKEFMQQQIRISIPGDCPDRPYGPEPQHQTPEQWRSGRLSKARQDLAYHEQHDAEERASAEQRTLWVKHLRMSLGFPR